MGKKAKEHRAKVEKRNKRIAQDKYAMQNALNKIMKKMAEEKEAESLKVKVGDKEVPFEVVSQPLGNSIVNFKEDGADFINDNEVVELKEQPVENQNDEI